MTGLQDLTSWSWASKARLAGCPTWQRSSTSCELGHRAVQSAELRAQAPVGGAYMAGIRDLVPLLYVQRA